MKTEVLWGIFCIVTFKWCSSRSIVKETPSISANTWTKVALTFDGASNTSWRNNVGSGTGHCLKSILGKVTQKQLQH